jgi:flagellin
MQINHNVAALNAWRNLGVSNSSLGKSLEKLSSGFRINRGGDDPAGLLISEQLRAQITGLDQATRNASDAVSMVQTAEGALTEMNTMLNSIRALAVHAANTGANDENSIMADQTAVDKAIESIQRIAVTTKFAGKFLLDGTAGTTITDSLGTKTSSIIVGTVAQSGATTVNVTTAASQAVLATTFNTTVGVASAGNAGTVTVWMEVGGVAQTVKNYSLISGESLTSLALAINADSETTGIVVSAGAGVNTFGFYTEDYGTEVTLRVLIDSEITGSAADANVTDAGADVVASISGTTLDGSGLVIYGSSTSTWANTEIALNTTGNTVGTVALSIAVGSLKFSLTQDGSTDDLISYSIANMQTTELGHVSSLAGTSNLDTIKSGATYALATNAASAIEIIDQAINDVSTERAQLGAFQKYTLETTINSIGITRENLAASESRIRDVDMAQEMMEFTKNQILVQAGMAMLAQANQLPSSILQLLK